MAKTFIIPVLRSCLPKSQRKVAKVSNAVMGKCLDCGLVILYRDNFFVRPAIWAAVGMEGYFAGFLHRACMQKRLGRELTKDDLTAWFLRDTAAGLEMECTAEGRDFALKIDAIEKVSDILSTALKGYIKGVRQVEVIGDDVILVHTTNQLAKYRSPSLVKAVRDYEKTGKFQLGNFDLVPP